MKTTPPRSRANLTQEAFKQIRSALADAREPWAEKRLIKAQVQMGIETLRSIYTPLTARNLAKGVARVAAKIRSFKNPLAI